METKNIIDTNVIVNAITNLTKLNINPTVTNLVNQSETDDSIVQVIRISFKTDPKPSRDTIECFTNFLCDLTTFDWLTFLETHFHTNHIDSIRERRSYNWHSDIFSNCGWSTHYYLKETQDNDEVLAYCTILLTDQTLTLVLTDPML